GIEFCAVVPAGIAHDAVVVANGRGERIHARGGELVRRICLAELKSAEAAGYTEEAVARSKSPLHFVVLVSRRSLAHRAGSWSRRHVDLGFDLEHHLLSATDVVIASESEVREIARNVRHPTRPGIRGGCRVAARSAFLDSLRDVIHREIQVPV